MDNLVGGEFISRVVNQYSDTIVRIAVQYTRNRADAEDIMQEVFLSLLKQPSFNDERHLKAWLIRVAINKSKNHLKVAARTKTVPLADAEHYLTKSQHSMLEELNELPEQDRNAVYLFYYEGYTAKEIASLIGGSQKAILMRLSRAREKLRHLLDVSAKPY